MTANELRIGNLVVLYPDEIRKVDTKMLGFMLNSERLNQETPFTPIPLTEEWLLKFGFTKSFIVTNFAIQIEAGVLDLTSSEIVGYHVYIDDNWICTIESVHELQNLYMAICGKELKIKL